MVVVHEPRRQGVEVVFLNHDLDESPEGRLLLQVQGIIDEYERVKAREKCRRGRLYAARSGQVSVLGVRLTDTITTPSRREVARPGMSSSSPRPRWSERSSPGWGSKDIRSVRCADDCENAAPYPHGQGELGSGHGPGHAAQPGLHGDSPLQQGPLRPGPSPVAPASGSPRVSTATHRQSGDAPRGPDPDPGAGDRGAGPVRGRAGAAGGAPPTSRPGGPRPRHLLAGLVVCQRCGYAYRGRAMKKKGGSRYGYYRCYGAEAESFAGRARICDNPAIRIERLDEAVWSDVRGLLLEPERLAEEFERRLSRANRGEGTTQSSRSLDKLIGQVRRRLARLVEMYADGYIEKEKFQRDMDISRTRMSELESERRAMDQEEQQREELRLVMGRIEEFGAQVAHGLDTSDVATRRRIICALVKKVEIDAEAVHIVYRVSPRPFAQTAPTDGNMPHCWGRSCGPLGRPRTSRRIGSRKE